MMTNKMKLNDSKTEVMIISSRHNAKLTVGIQQTFGEELTILKPLVKNFSAVLVFKIKLIQVMLKLEMHC